LVECLVILITLANEGRKDKHLKSRCILPTPYPEKPNIKPPKLPLKLTVAQFAVFARACMDLEIFDVSSVAELTRILPAMISTLRTSEISAKSLRNHMESISIEDIDRTVFDLRKILQYLNVMRNRMERET
jgi:hypothetical protein